MKHIKHEIPVELKLTIQEHSQIEGWNKKHDRACPFLKKEPHDKYTSEFSPYGTIGGGRTYCLTPTSIGTIITVRCACGEEFLVDNNL